MNNNNLIARIEKDLISKRLETLKKLKPQILKKLKEIEDKAFAVWNIDTVYTGLIMLQSFNECVKNKLTLDQLADIVENEGYKYKSFDILLRKAVKASNRKGKKNIIKRIIGKTSRNTKKV